VVAFVIFYASGVVRANWRSEVQPVALIKAFIVSGFDCSQIAGNRDLTEKAGWLVRTS
jgi:hypothetical protein